MAAEGSSEQRSPSALIDARIGELGDWRGEMLRQVRALIMQADPDVVEEWKWRGVPVWSDSGIICTGETYKSVVKLTFAKGAALEDPSGLFNSSLEGNVRRAIDIREGEKLDEAAFIGLVRAAVDINREKAAGRQNTGRGPARRKAESNREPEQPSLLSGGNPQIAKGDGDAPVQAYIAAMPGWKRDVGRKLDALIMQSVPEARKAVRWNSPFYGTQNGDWFASFHVFTNYVKLTFLNGAQLQPPPPGGTPRSRQARWIDIHQEDAIDANQIADWVRQAAG